MSSNKKNERRAEILMLTIMALSAICCVILIVCIGFKGSLFSPDFELPRQNEAADQSTAVAEEEKESPSSGVIYIDMDRNTDYAGENTENRETISSKPAGGMDYERYIFVGDSRYVGMSACAGAQDVFIAEVGEGYAFLLRQLDSIRSQCSEKTAVIIGLGVNDMSGDFSQKYIQTLNQLCAELPGDVFFMSVNPVNEGIEQKNGYHITNMSIDTFNEKLRAGLDGRIGFIDTNSFLKGDGFVSTDGLHYNNETYSKIYDYIKINVMYR